MGRNPLKAKTGREPDVPLSDVKSPLFPSTTTKDSHSGCRRIESRGSKGGRLEAGHLAGRHS